MIDATRNEPSPDEVTSSTSPQDVATTTGRDARGDLADQADRLAMIMEAEAARVGLMGSGAIEASEDLHNPLADPEDLLAEEDAEDASDDPLHGGGLRPTHWTSAEEAAMHVIDPDRPDEISRLDDPTPAEQADPGHDPFQDAPEVLTPEDETILGIDPFEGSPG